jgi:hypothetical protein
MNQRIIYSTPDGGIAVITPTGSLPIEQVLAKDVPSGATGIIVEADAIPSDRSFRGAWTRDGAAITHDMAKAREIHRDRIRAARDPKLTALDVAVQRELEKPNPNTAQIFAQKQSLRDAPANPAINAATTISQLKAAWDATLLGPSPY